MGYYLSFLILGVLAIAENSVLINLRLLDGQPSLVLLAVAAWSWHGDFWESIFWCFVGGIALDVLNPIAPTGVSIIAMVVMVFAVKTVERLFYQVSIFALVAFVVLGTLVHHVIIYSTFALQGIAVPLPPYIQNYTVPTLTFNLIGILPMYWLLRRIQKRIPQRQSPWAVEPR